MSSTASQIENTTEDITTSFDENVETGELTETETSDSVKHASKSSRTQTELFINQRPKKNKTTQTCKNLSRNTLDKVKNKSAATQTYIAKNACRGSWLQTQLRKPKFRRATQAYQIEIKQSKSTIMPNILY